MSKLNEAEVSSSATNLDGKTEEGNVEKEDEAKDADDEVIDEVEVEEKITKIEDDKKEILKFTMLFNKVNCDLDMKRRNDESKRDNKWTMFFNKEVTIRPNAELKDSNSAAKMLTIKKSGNLEKTLRQSPSNRTNKTRFHFFNQSVPEPQISEPGMMYSSSLIQSSSDIDVEPLSRVDSIKKFFYKRNPKVESFPFMQVNLYPTPQKDLRGHNSLTNLPKTTRTGLRGVENLKSKIPSLTALDTTTSETKLGLSYWDDFMLLQNDVDKRLNLQISRSSNDNNRRSALKFKKEDPASVSDSKLLDADSESKKPIKKCDKKSRGDSSRKEKDNGNRKQVQWKTEVDVIYFSTNLAANGDRTREIIGRVMEPLREEWEQQRKGFYAKVVPSQMENHVKDRFISLLKI